MEENDRVIRKAFECPQWYLTSRAYNIKIRCETVRRFLGERDYNQVLDIGCGDGSLSVPLLNEKTELTLLDRSQSMLQIAISRVPEELAERVSVVNDDFIDADLEYRRYDLVICVGVLAYVNDLAAFLRKIASVLRPGGTLILECTDGSHLMSAICRAYLRLRWQFNRDGLFRTVRRSSATVLRVAGEMGFERRGSFRYSLPPPVLGKVMSQGISYRVIRSIFGSAERNRAPWLGNECLFHFGFSDHRSAVSSQGAMSSRRNTETCSR